MQAIGTTPEEARDLANAVIDAVAVEAQEIENTGRPASAKRRAWCRSCPLEEAQLPGAPFTPDYRAARDEGRAPVAWCWPTPC